MHLGDSSPYEGAQKKQLIILLRELQGKRGHSLRPVLQFTRKPYDDLPNTYPVYVPDLLAEWPRNVPERIERAFCHLINAELGKMPAGAQRAITSRGRYEPLVFANAGDEEEYFIKAMVEYAWLTLDVTNDPRLGSDYICITPKGWAYFDELNRGKGDASNPAFVAMWFGGDDERDRMDKLYADAIEPAVKAAGYKVIRADSDEHNDEIMGKVMEYIRKAPFVVADLTNRNNGVYYEAGFAKGCGKEVILCCPKNDKQHFDVSGLYQVRYADVEDLEKKLENRILGPMTRGPHRFDDGVASGD
jgi:hypothetical protein